MAHVVFVKDERRGRVVGPDLLIQASCIARVGCKRALRVLSRNDGRERQHDARSFWRSGVDLSTEWNSCKAYGATVVRLSIAY